MNDSFASLGAAETPEKARKLYRILDRDRKGDLPMADVVGVLEAAEEAERALHLLEYIKIKRNQS